jgi:O-antigen ligase
MQWTNRMYMYMYIFLLCSDASQVFRTTHCATVATYLFAIGPEFSEWFRSQTFADSLWNSRLISDAFEFIRIDVQQFEQGHLGDRSGKLAAQVVAKDTQSRQFCEEANLSRQRPVELIRAKIQYL